MNSWKVPLKLRAKLVTRAVPVIPLLRRFEAGSSQIPVQTGLQSKTPALKSFFFFLCFFVVRFHNFYGRSVFIWPTYLPYDQQCRSFSCWEILYLTSNLNSPGRGQWDQKFKVWEPTLKLQDSTVENRHLINVLGFFGWGFFFFMLDKQWFCRYASFPVPSYFS